MTFTWNFSEVICSHVSENQVFFFVRDTIEWPDWARCTERISQQASALSCHQTQALIKDLQSVCNRELIHHFCLSITFSSSECKQIWSRGNPLILIVGKAEHSIGVGPGLIWKGKRRARACFSTPSLCAAFSSSCYCSKHAIRQHLFCS